MSTFLALLMLASCDRPGDQPQDPDSPDDTDVPVDTEPFDTDPDTDLDTDPDPDLLNADVPVFSSDIIYLTVGDPLLTVPSTGWQDLLDGWTYAFDNSDPANPIYLCQHDDPTTEVKFEEWDFPTEPEPCVQPPPSVEPAPVEPLPPHTGPAGTNPLPGPLTGWAGWDGGGGCGVWSVAMCNRILGITDPTTQVTETEWDQIAVGIHLNLTTGASKSLDRANYYKDRGYCAEMKRFDGSPDDYAELVEKVDSGECDVKVAFWRREDGAYVSGHTEVVTGATLAGMVTNSWGSPAVIEGGSEGGFHHSGDGTSFKRDGGGFVWPPGATEIDVTYVCPCGWFDALGNLILGG